MKHPFRAFLWGFVPTLCVFALAAGLCTVWVNTQLVMTPGAALFQLQESEPFRYTLEAFGTELSFQLPKLPDQLTFFSKYPSLLPRSLRLTAWIWDNLSQWMAYLRDFLPY